MLFITRELFEFMQRDDLTYDERERKWNEAEAARLEHHANIKGVMNNDMSEFMDITLHDGVIKQVDRSIPDEIELEIDGRYCPWGPRGLFTLAFRGVKCVEGLDECIGARWMYEEVHLHPDAKFDYQVLVMRRNETTELRLVADEVEFTITEPGPTPVIGVNIPFQAPEGLYVWSNLDDSGTTMGWCCITDGRKVPKSPSPEIREMLRKFAKGIGAVIPDEVKELPAGEAGDRSE